MRSGRPPTSVDLASSISLPVMPFAGGYLTDEETLFRIERTLVDSRGELLVELEDCGTLELIVCSAHFVGDLGLRPVQPSSLA